MLPHCLSLSPKLPSSPLRRPLTTEDRVMGSPELHAALERGRRAVLVRPPAVEHATDIWELLPERVLIVCPDRATAMQFADAAPADASVHAITSLGRATRLLKAGGADIVAGALPDLIALVAQSALKPETFELIV